MTTHLPYNLLDKQQIIQQINSLAAKHSPFLFIIDYKAEQGYVIKQEDLDEQFICFNIDRSTPTHAFNSALATKIQWDTNPIPLEEYQAKFDFVLQQIHRGNSFLTNLTQPTEVRTNLSIFDIYNLSQAKYKLWLSGQFVVLSPETFVRIEDRIISSFPMKGTIDASILHAEEIIINDPKEMAEHATIVDLIRNDLSLVASQVEVKRYRYIDKIATNKPDLLQVSSEISGLLPDNYHERLGDILFALLPAGSICGAPKQKTLEIIEEVEGYKRSFYTGICGYFDGENLDSAVMIRFVEQNGAKLIFKSGGGITSKSEMIKEYEELIQKIYVPIC